MVLGFNRNDYFNKAVFQKLDAAITDSFETFGITINIHFSIGYERFGRLFSPART